MATGRKGPSAPPSRKRSLTTPSDDDLGVEDVEVLAVSTGAGSDDLVAVVRGLAAAVADHGLPT